MFRVSDFMTPDPITVDPSETISDALDLMKTHGIHRIPVVDADNVLKGLITEGLISSNGNATSLSIYELNYLLSKTKVKTMMKRNPWFIKEDALLEEAAEMMQKHDIGCLPVVDENQKVTGILTQNDIFTSFLQMLGWKTSGSRILVEVKDQIGALEHLSKVFADAGISLRNISVYSYEDDIARILIRTQEKIDEAVLDLLNKEGFTVVEFTHA
jgi:acetoin utilization protein AcuB